MNHHSFSGLRSEDRATCNWRTVLSITLYRKAGEKVAIGCIPKATPDLDARAKVPDQDTGFGRAGMAFVPTFLFLGD